MCNLATGYFSASGTGKAATIRTTPWIARLARLRAAGFTSYDAGVNAYDAGIASLSIHRPWHGAALRLSGNLTHPDSTGRSAIRSTLASSIIACAGLARWSADGCSGGLCTRSTFGNDFVKLDYGLTKLTSLITTNMSNELLYQYGRELDDEGQQTFTPYTTPTWAPAATFRKLAWTLPKA